MKTNREQFLERHGLPRNTSLSIEEIATLSDIPIEALKTVAERGASAWLNNPQSIRLKDSFKKDANEPRIKKLSKQQWLYARVYAFANKSQKVYYGADNDIRKKYGLD